MLPLASFSRRPLVSAKARLSFAKSGKSLCFLLLLLAAGLPLLQSPRFLPPKAANLFASSCFFQPQPPRFCKGPCSSAKGGKSLYFLLLLLTAGLPLLQRPRFFPPKALNFFTSSCFFQPKPLAPAKTRLSFAKGSKFLCLLLLLPVEDPRSCKDPAFFHQRRQISLPPLASSDRRPTLLRSSRLYEVPVFIQKLAFERERKRLSVGQARNRMETN